MIKFADMNILEQTIQAIREASSLMVSPGEGFSIEQKGGLENIVTSSDIAVQKRLCESLERILPGCGFICEENDVFDPDKEFVWIIDPIDGTANYARGWGECAISVALTQGTDILMGIIYSPGRNELYYAEKGKGAFCNGKRITTSDRTFEDGILCSALSTYRKQFSGVCSDIIMDTYRQCNDIRRFGAASVEFGFLAKGLCELYFEIRLQPWDYAAGILLIREAGGVITNLDGDQPSFSGPDLVCAANNAGNHARLLGIIRSHLATLPYTD